MTFAMLSLEVDLRELHRLAAVHGVAGDEGRMLHHALSEAFGKSVAQPFRLLPGRNGARRATLYAYTSHGEADLREALATTAPPEAHSLLRPASLRWKAMPNAWRPGRVLAFDVRIRPVSRLLRPLEAGTGQPPFKKGAEVDAFLIAAIRAGQSAPSREEVYRDWLAKRLAGAELLPERTHLKAFERSSTRYQHRAGEAPTAIFHGALRITDGALFAARLQHGIGRHIAYGFGMLLLRPAGG